MFRHSAYYYSALCLFSQFVLSQSDDCSFFYRLQSDLVILSRDMLSFFFDYPNNLAKNVLAKIPRKIFLTLLKRIGDMVSHSFQAS